MSNQQKWREEQILVICPGSETTLAHLGTTDLSIPQHRFPTRMFKDPDSDDYVPYKICKRKKEPPTSNGNGYGNAKPEEDEYEYVEDRDSVEGAIYPMVGGSIKNMNAFLAFLDHVHNTLTTSYHNTPIVLMAAAQWSRWVNETITRYIFEKTKTPALLMIRAALCAHYSNRYNTMTIVDIGRDKVDVTAIHDYQIVNYRGLGYASPEREISGGEVFTQKLLSLLKDKGFTYDMAEQLKKSPICEVLPFEPDRDELMELPTEDVSSTVLTTGAGIDEPRAAANVPIISTDDNGTSEDKGNDDGVLDVANIVTTGNTREFLAKKEKEKAERAKKKGKGQEAEPAVAKLVRLPNSKRRTNIFHYEELVHDDVQVPVTNGQPTTGDANNGGPTVTQFVTERRTKRIRRDIEVGSERFLFADRDEIDRICMLIYNTIQGIHDMYKRPACWEHLFFVGNGSRLRGLKENIIQSLNARYLISPSSATIFSSELPSNVATPTGTGSQTPTGSFNGQPPLPTTSSVNPLLLTATTSNLGAAQAPGSNAGEATSHGHSFHSQTPTSIKMALPPTYLGEWTKHGFEEANFLGACIAGRVIINQNNETDAYLTRVEYNQQGPRAVRFHSMLYY